MPKLILALAFVAALGPGVENAIIAIAITAWPTYARIARAETLTFRNSEFIAAVQMQGASAARIISAHILPLCTSSMIIRVTLDMAGIILTAAGLGFIGLGAQPPLPEWGAMISRGRTFILDQWWVATMPGFAIIIVSLGFCFLGDGLRDVLDPRQGGKVVTDPLLEIANLRVSFPTPYGRAEVVRGISFELGRERLGIVGESGSGKSLTGRSILSLIRPPGRITADRLNFSGIDILAQSERQMRAIRGARISMVMQDPKFSLNPVMTIGAQIAEALIAHTKLPRREIAERSRDMLEAVRNRRPRARHAASPPRGIRRHGPTRDDRHDAGARTRPVDRRRTDLRAGRLGFRRRSSTSWTSWSATRAWG